MHMYKYIDKPILREMGGRGQVEERGTNITTKAA